MKWLIIFLLLMPSATAWLGTGHENIVILTYYQLDNNNLNLSEMIRGSTDPDRVFHDTRNHHFPDSFPKSKKWLDQVKIDIKNKDFNNASYAFGVASHYISDSFAAPHNVEKEDSSKHSKYEKTANNFLVSGCKNRSVLFDVLSNHTKPNDWYNWINTNEKKIVYDNFNQAFLAVQSQTFIIQPDCKQLNTKIIYNKTNSMNYRELKLFLLILVIYFTFKLWKP